MFFLQFIGRTTVGILQNIGALAVFITKVIQHILTPPYYTKQTVQQFWKIGYLSLPVVGLTAIFTGMVLALQSYTGFSRFSAEGAMATVVVLSMTRELGPVLAGLMVAGRVGASIAAQIGTMRITEQLDALQTLSVNSFKYLIAPRVIAGTVCLPLLVLLADSIGVLGGYLISTYKLGFSSSEYLKQTFAYLHWEDIQSGLIKASVFGFIITTMGCYHGFYSGRGAEGVGISTTNAVVSISIMILLCNYALTSLLFVK